jgi:hypothetical protein
MESRVNRARSQRPIAALLVALVLGVGAAGIGGRDAAAASRLERSGPVPASLKTVESSAEDIVDFALGGDRANVREAAAALKKAARGPAASDLRAAKIPAAFLALLARRADRVATLAAAGPLVRVALAANAVSALMPNLYAHFADRVPANVLTLDYLDREAQLRSLAGEQAAVVSSVHALATTWPPVRRRVLAVGGLKEARSFDSHVAAMKRLARSSNRDALQREAVNGLNLVDTLESLFA